MTRQMTTAYDVMIHGFVRELMETEGLNVDEARERLQRYVDDACDDIAYGNDDE